MPWFIMITYAFVLKSFVAKIVKVFLADFVSTGFSGSVTWVSFTISIKNDNSIASCKNLPIVYLILSHRK